MPRRNSRDTLSHPAFVADDGRTVRHFVSKNTRGATRTRLRWSSVEEAANLMAAYMVISSPVSIFEENTPLTGWSMPQAGQAVCDQCHIKADFHVLRDEAAEALHSLRDAFLIGRNDLAQSRASRLNVAAASVGWLCRWRAARVRETVPYAPQRAGGREVQVRLLKEDVAAWSESQTSDQTSGRRTSAERTSASLTLAGLRGSQLRDGELRRGGPQGQRGEPQRVGP
jgi:hypothetical protein